jgi:peptidoglycan/xylan/chitin deacetylase (PgdA/CDA1 family)
MTWADERTHGLLASLLGDETATRLHRQKLTVRTAAREAVTLLKERPPDQIEHLIRTLEDHSRALPARSESSHVDALMSWDEVRRLRDSGLVAIGAHGESHTPFTKLQRPAAFRELKDSAARLRLELAAPVDALAYPNGDHDQTTCSLAQASGYRVAFTTRNGAVAPGADAYRLCRISIHENAAPNVYRLACRMLGLF